MTARSAATLAALHWYLKLADQLLERDHPSHPLRAALPDCLELLEEVSFERNRGDDDLPHSEPDELIDTATAANLMNLTQRRVQQKIKNGELKAAKKFGRTSFLNRRDIA